MYMAFPVYSTHHPPSPNKQTHSLRWFLAWVRRRHGEARAAALWREMGEICVKTVLSILPTLVRDYNALFGPDAKEVGGGAAAAAGVWGSRAFELLGFDIMVDQALKPWLIEVNTLPRQVPASGRTAAECLGRAHRFQTQTKQT